MDKTGVSSLFGRKKEAFSTAKTHHGGKRTEVMNGGNKHLTAVIITSAAGGELSPFFIFAGRSAMKWLFETLDREMFDGFPDISWLLEKDWMPEKPFIVRALNGSMGTTTIHHVIDHTNEHARKNCGKR